MTRGIDRLCAAAGLALSLAAGGCRHPATTVAVRRGAQAEDSGGYFRDVTAGAGIHYSWTPADPRPLNAMQTIGNGCAFLDFDGDGNLDVVLVGNHLSLYRGDGKGVFTDVSQTAALSSLTGRFLGCAVGDYDNDGRPDIYITGYRTGILLHNDGGVRFRDVTKQAGLAPQPFGTSAIFFDYDGDGNLDLYVCNYLHFGPDTVPQLCEAGAVKTACGPRWYGAEKGVLYRNAGGGRFADVSARTGATEVSGKALGVYAADLDGSGRQSLLITNDEMPGDLLKNTGGQFINVGPESGTAYDDSGNPHGGMGVDGGDYDNDGKMDFIVGTFQNEVKNVYHNEGRTYADRAPQLGMQAPIPFVAFGVKWADFNNDGYQDLAIANGHIQDNIEKVDPRATYLQPTLILMNDHGSRFTDVSGAWLSSRARRPIAGRGLAVGDYDNDGRLDLLIVDSEGSPLLLHNEMPKEKCGAWAGFDLRQTGPNRFGVGATVTVRSGKLKWTRWSQPGGSYMSSSDPRIHVGLGAVADRVDVEVKWPGGPVEEWIGQEVGRYATLTRGAGRAVRR